MNGSSAAFTDKGAGNTGTRMMLDNNNEGEMPLVVDEDDADENFIAVEAQHNKVHQTTDANNNFYKFKS